MITPEIINPIIPGTFNRFNKIGESKMINNISENINTGFLSGS
jgi:hypothetical protein